MRRVIVASALVGAVVAFLVWSNAERRQPSTIQLHTPNGTLVVEVANTPARRFVGLSNRQSLNVDGLLLEWETTGTTSNLDGGHAILAST